MKKTLQLICEAWPGIVIIMVTILFICFLIGYFANALAGYKFDLNAIWAGIAALASGSLAILAKYYTDSRFNTLQGHAPTFLQCGGMNNATGNIGRTSPTGRNGAE